MLGEQRVETTSHANSDRQLDLKIVLISSSAPSGLTLSPRLCENFFGEFL